MYVRVNINRKWEMYFNVWYVFMNVFLRCWLGDVTEILVIFDFYINVIYLLLLICICDVLISRKEKLIIIYKGKKLYVYIFIML